MRRKNDGYYYHFSFFTATRKHKNETIPSKEAKYTISVDLKSSFSYRKIARRLGRSPSTISREIARNKGLRGYRYRQAQKLADERRHRKCALSGQKRQGKIIGSQSIHLRDDIINKRRRLGDFEGDTVIGKGHKGAILILVDKKSRYEHIARLEAPMKLINTICLY